MTLRSWTPAAAITLAFVILGGGVACGGSDRGEPAQVTATHEVLGPEVYDATPRKFATAFCAQGETITGGGYSLAGDFQTVGSPAPELLPLVTESAQVQRDDSDTVGWGISAIAPSGFKGKWALRARAMCK